MPVTREQIVTAVEAYLNSSFNSNIPLVDAGTGQTITPALPQLKFIARRVRDPENVKSTDRPCIYLVEHLDDWDQESIDLPSVRGMVVWALLYVDVGTQENLIPMTQINYYIEVLEALFNSNSPQCAVVFDGLVRSIQIAGEGIRASGDTTGKCLAAIPIRIVLP